MQLIIRKIDDFSDLDIVMEFLTCCYRNIVMEEHAIAKTKETDHRLVVTANWLNN